METVYRDYRDKVNFYYVYKSVQHPEVNNFVSAFSVEERLKHVAEAKRMFQTEIPWLCDDMEDTVRRFFGRAPNSEFVMDADGKILRKRFWSHPGELRTYLAELVGKSETTTTVDDLPTIFTPEPREVASGVVPRLELPAGLTPLAIEPQPDDEHPYFVKLRVEATNDLLMSGRGQLYFVAYVDPLYKVHWNNRAGNVKLKVIPNEQQSFAEKEFQSPEVKEDADIDPREFLTEAAFHRNKSPFRVELTYTVCDDAETFCITVTQEYLVKVDKHGDLGSRPGIFMPEMFAKVRELDKNGDGDLTKDELPEGKVTLYIGHIDYSGNEIIEKEEIDRFMTIFNNGKGFFTDKNDGSGQPSGR